MKRIAFVLAAVFTTAVFAQGRDFNGRWIFDAEKSGSKNGPPAMTIALTAKEFTLTMEAPGHKETVVLRTDGTDVSLEHGERARAEWKGDRLVATVVSSRGTSTVSTFREGEWLVQEATNARGPMKLYFKKAPAK